MKYKRIKDDYCTTRDLMSLLGITRQAIGQYRDKGMPHEKISSRIHTYDLEECKKWIKENIKEVNNGRNKFQV